MDKIDTLATSSAAVCSILAAVTPTEEVRLLAFNALGSVAGGYVGASMNTDATQGEASRKSTLARRWAVNFSAGLFIGPVLTDYLTGKFPEFSRLYLSIACGGVCGVAAVSVLCILTPWLLAKLKSSQSKLP